MVQPTDWAVPRISRMTPVKLMELDLGRMILKSNHICIYVLEIVRIWQIVFFSFESHLSVFQANFL